MAITITKENFENEVMNSDKPVLVDFWATWCGPCRMVAPVIDEIAEEMSDTLKVGKVDVDEQQELAVKFNVMSIPTLALFKDGKNLFTEVGARSKEEIMDMIKNAIQ